MQIGSHSQPVKDVASVIVPNNNIDIGVVITGGWDSRVKFWTWTAPNQLNCLAEVYLAMPVHYMSCVYPLLVTAHQDRIIHLFNLEDCFKKQSYQPC